MSEMVERVARALAPLAWAALGTGDTLAHENRRKASLRHAKAAIEAMRNPPMTMTQAGGNYAMEYGAAPWLASEIFDRMIAAALSEKP